MALVLTGCLLSLFPAVGTVSAQNWGALSDGSINIMLSSHQDLGWENSIPYCNNVRNEKIIKPVLEWMGQTDTDYRYTFEYVYSLMHYLETYPDALETVREHTQSGRFQWGAAYIDFYESLYSSEGVVRQFYLGKKWMKTALGGGCDSRTYINVDPPQRGLQIPQILNKAGVDFLVTSRTKSGFLRWSSPNAHAGSTDDYSVLVYSNGQYGIPWIWSWEGTWNEGMLSPYAYQFKDDSGPPPAYPSSLISAQTKVLFYWSQYTDPTVHQGSPPGTTWEGYFQDSGFPARFPILYSNDMGIPAPYLGVPTGDYASDLVKDWNQWKEHTDPGWPEIRLSTCDQALGAFWSAATEMGASFEEWMGERPNLWLYSHGPGHHWAGSAIREAGRLLPAAETFATIDCLLSGDFSSYPSEYLLEGWKGAIFPGHGWGGVDGEDTDNRFLWAAQTGERVGREVLTDALESIAARVDTAAGGDPIIVFNTLPWERSDPVICRVEPEGENWSIVDADWAPVTCQVLDDAGGSKEIVFIARNVPSLGYRTYYLLEDGEGGTMPARSAVPGENQYYQWELSPGGFTSLTDRELNVEILATAKSYGGKSFRGAECFSMGACDCGTGTCCCGAFEVQTLTQPVPSEDFRQMSDYGVGWTEVEEGPVRNAFAYEVAVENCTASQKLIFYRDIKRIDCEFSMQSWNGTGYREWRMALPLNLDKGFVSYEVPMGVVQVGRDDLPFPAGGHFNEQTCSYVTPREVQNFISVSGPNPAFGEQTFGVTMSSSVAVSNYIFPPNNDVGPDSQGQIANPIPQPILMATRHSNKSDAEGGNLWSQAGDHNYHFSIFSHEGDWRNGWRSAVQSNSPLIPVVGVAPSAGADLPEEKSFCSVSPDNIVLTAFKKREDDVFTTEGTADENLIVRFYDIEGRDTSDAEIRFFFTVNGAEKTNIIEEPMSGGGTGVSVSGQSVKLSVGHHSIETLKIVPGPIPQPTPDYIVLQSGDYNGDGISDIAIFRQSTGLWAVRGLGRVYFGTAGDIPVSGDYNGDGIADISVFRPATGLWAIKWITRLYFGGGDDLPVPGDFNGDGSCDVAVFGKTTGRWSLRDITRVYFGTLNDRPVPGDYDGDGGTDISIFRPASGLWAIREISRCYFGAGGDHPVPGVYSWYGRSSASPFKDQIAIFRPSSGLWAIRGITRAYFGTSGDTPLRGDFDANSLDNIAIFRPYSGLWAVREITRAYFGTFGDLPVTR
ncbi:MAG: glycosyl hydrolase-related protein [PVC group bacterium]